MATKRSIDEQIGSNVKAAAKAAGVTQEALALDAKIALRTFGYLVAGKAEWRMTQLFRVADALDVDAVTDLLAGTGKAS